MNAKWNKITENGCIPRRRKQKIYKQKWRTWAIMKERLDLEQRETTELARGESWGMGLGELREEGEEDSPFSPAIALALILRLKRDLKDRFWLLITKPSSIPTFTFSMSFRFLGILSCFYLPSASASIYIPFFLIWFWSENVIFRFNISPCL